jgi:hypothetical protein
MSNCKQDHMLFNKDHIWVKGKIEVHDFHINNRFLLHNTFGKLSEDSHAVQIVTIADVDL